MSPCVKLLSKESGTVIRPRRNASSTDRPRPSVNASELSSTSESNAASAPSSFAADVTELPSTELSKESDAIFAVMIDSDASPATRSTERSFWICPMMSAAVERHRARSLREVHSAFEVEQHLAAFRCAGHLKSASPEEVHQGDDPGVEIALEGSFFLRWNLPGVCAVQPCDEADPSRLGLKQFRSNQAAVVEAIPRVAVDDIGKGQLQLLNIADAAIVLQGILAQRCDRHEGRVKGIHILLSSVRLQLLEIREGRGERLAGVGHLHHGSVGRGCLGGEAIQHAHGDCRRAAIGSNRQARGKRCGSVHGRIQQLRHGARAGLYAEQVPKRQVLWFVIPPGRSSTELVAERSHLRAHRERSRTRRLVHLEAYAGHRRPKKKVVAGALIHGRQREGVASQLHQNVGQQDDVHWGRRRRASRAREDVRTEGVPCGRRGGFSERQLVVQCAAR
eukprot:scaffold3327_cov242-Pinguiococcus_pyrenoidosus.AAC.3